MSGTPHFRNDIERDVYAARGERFRLLAQTGWTQAVEAEVGDLVQRVLRGESINIGLDDHVKKVLAAEAEKGMIFYGNDPKLKIKYGDRKVSGDCFVRAGGAPATPLDDYVLLAAVDEHRQQTGGFETPRLTVEELGDALALPADSKHSERLATVLFKLRDEGAVTRDDDGRWRAAKKPPAQPSGEARPRWLQIVAIRVDELVAEPKVMDRFRQMLRDWKAWHEARGPKSAVDKRGSIRHHPDGSALLPIRALTLPENYTVLAAIHDKVCKRAKRIDPWGTHKRRGFAQSKAGIAYAVLCSGVSDLTDADEPRVEAILQEVEADLRQRQLTDVVRGEGQAPAAPTTKQKGRGKKNRSKTPRRASEPKPLTARQTEVAQIVAECKGNVAQAAKRLGLHHATVQEHYEAAMGKLGKRVVKHATQRLRTDRRGQENIADGDDLRRQ